MIILWANIHAGQCYTRLVVSRSYCRPHKIIYDYPGNCSGTGNNIILLQTHNDSITTAVSGVEFASLN